MTVQITDVKHLDKVMKSLRGVKGVLAVERARPSGKDTRRPRRRLSPRAGSVSGYSLS